MLMPKNGAATATPCGKNNMAAVYSAYNGHAAPDAFQQMAMPLNGQYPVASKLWIAPAKNCTFLERSKNVAPMFAERSLWTSLERTFVDSAKRSLNVRQ